MLESIKAFLRLESASGILLLAAAVLGMILANTAESSYQSLLSLRLTVAAGDFALSKPLLLWINDGLMAVFFFLIGLELKREVLEGELATRSQIALPALAAAGGMLVPGLIYAAINWS